MHNVKHEVKGNLLILTIDVGPAAIAAAPLSSTGKKKLVAVGYANDGRITFSVNVTAAKS